MTMRSQKLGFLNSVLCKWHSQATLIGKSVLPVLLLIRLVILGAAVHTVWLDEEEFVCNTQMEGCTVSCYNLLTPLAPARLWTLQLLLVLAPGLVFLCYLIHLTNQENQVRRGDGEVKGHPLGVYQACTASVILVEVGFVVMQSLLHGFWVNEDYSCKTVLPVLQFIRLVVVVAAVQPVWDNDLRDFFCDTQQPGCSQAGFNHLFPISLYHYWTLQWVLVLAPGLIFFCYLVHLIVLEKQSGPGTQVKGHVLGAYLALLLAVVLLEVGFAVVQKVVFGFSLSTMHTIMSTPCPSRVECYVSQATEKTVFMVIMFSLACLSGLLTLVELCMVLMTERPWVKQREHKIPETSGLQMELNVKDEADTTEQNESYTKLNI
ncbi:gap junction Cx32.2 protein-like isoform X2 [Channa argus]|uniref:gap junction Cx32.2 protein-like isoform X2 n=1 Tax=Channa argus TaxID=215402 RepID=UPI003521D836